MTERNETAHKDKMITVPSCWSSSFPVRKEIQSMFTVRTQCKKWLRCSPSRQHGTPSLIFSNTFMNGTELQTCLTRGCRHPQNKMEIWVWGNRGISSLESIQFGLCGSKQLWPHFFRNRCWMDSTRTTNQRQFYLGQWFSTLLMLQPFNTVPHGVATPTTNYFAAIS